MHEEDIDLFEQALVVFDMLCGAVGVNKASVFVVHAGSPDEIDGLEEHAHLKVRHCHANEAVDPAWFEFQSKAEPLFCPGELA